MRLAIIIPVLNESAALPAALAVLQPLRERGTRVLVVDGGSHDDSVACAVPLADRVVAAARGRALQMNAGARDPAAADADVLLFLHADTRLPPDADRLLLRALANSRSTWGRFDVRIAGRSALLPLVAAMMNGRSRLTSICTGDQAIFVTRGAFLALDGFAPIALMEDIDFSRRARRCAWPRAVRDRAITSGRRWERHGVVRTVLLMWRLRLAYYFGADPARLAASYRDAR